jgi:hypothetical protein
MIDAIITENNVKNVVNEISNRLVHGIKGQPLKDIKLVDVSNEVVLLVSSEAMTQEVADAFWLGYKKALE